MFQKLHMLAPSGVAAAVTGANTQDLHSTVTSLLVTALVQFFLVKFGRKEGS